MSRTAMHEHFGACLVAAPSGDLVLPLPFGPGGARLIDLDPTTVVDCYMPDARLLKPGGQQQYLILNRSADSINVLDAAAGGIETIDAGHACRFWLLDNANAAGEWDKQQLTFASGSTLSGLREPWTVDLTGQLFDFNLQTHLLAMGWDGVTPVAIQCTVRGSAAIGSSSNASPPAAAFTTGTGWPTGSTLRLTLEAGAIISGRGGAGGSGGDVPPGLLAQDGRPGGVGLYVGMSTTLVSYGTIAGGGGGGGGGARSGQAPGGGGGGGAGFLFSAGGAEGTGGTGGAQPGLPGSLWVAGGGGTGAQNGGTGGGPGQAGSAAGAAGGAAGAAIQYLGSGITWTKVRSGTISGSEVSV